MLPQGINPLTVDRSKPFIDIKTTTVDGVVREIITDYYLPNIVDGVNGFYGSVIEVIDDPSKFENGSGFSLLTSAKWLTAALGQIFSPGQMEKRYKVRVPNLNSNLTNPYSTIDKKIAGLDQARKDKILLHYNEFTLSPTVNQTPVLGDIVFVTYGNLQTRTDGVIMYRVGPVPTAADLANSPLGGILRQFNGLISGGLLGQNIPPAPPPPAGPAAELQQLDISIPVNAAIKGNPLNPNPDLYARVIDQFSVENNPRYVIRDVSGDFKKDTFCNILVYDVTRAMGADGGVYWLTNKREQIPEADHDISTNDKWKKDYRPQNADNMTSYLQSAAAKKRGWRQVTAIEAQIAANMGFCVISGGHGHVTVIRPGSIRMLGDADDPLCSSAGGDNKNGIPNSRSYGKLQGISYHVYVSPKAPAGFYESKREQLKAKYLPIEKNIQDLTNSANSQTDPQKKYEIELEIYKLTLLARSYGSLLPKRRAPVEPRKPSAANKPRPSNASKA